MADVEDFRTLRTCPRCQYPVRPGYFHEERPQPEGSNVTVCSLRRAPRGCILRGPLVDVLSQYFDEAQPPNVSHLFDGSRDAPDPRLSVEQALTLAEANLEKLQARRQRVVLELGEIELEIRGLRMAIARETAQIDGSRDRENLQRKADSVGSPPQDPTIVGAPYSDGETGGNDGG